MGLFDKLLNKNKGVEYQGLPENERLINLIANWYSKPNNDTYKNVVMELMRGAATLLLPSQNDNLNTNNEWTTATKDTKLKLTTIYEVDSIKVLDAFSDEEALLNWSGRGAVPYVALKSNDILILCEQNGISRLVINSNSYNMFVLERSRDLIRKYDIPSGTTLNIGTAERKLPKRVIEKILIDFRSNNNIIEAYQYIVSQANEYSLVLGVLLVADSEDARSAVIFSVQDAIRGEEIEEPLDIFFITDQQWLNSIKQIPEANFYKK